mmetsp:Transcript_32855/g.50226  ORF Transcript_32855/g.50226 Transcript_32855/m.50226 type:complete len:100 (+) Transcript_32855:7203-7502(+)
MEPNIPGLRKLYETFFEPRKRYMSIDDAIRLFMKDTGILAKDTDVIYCFGMSKMTCVVETKDSDKKYHQLIFPEFLELIGRVAQFKFKDNEEMQDQSLA